MQENSLLKGMCNEFEPILVIKTEVLKQGWLQQVAKPTCCCWSMIWCWMMGRTQENQELQGRLKEYEH